jgi:hypothetical protein
MCFADVGNTRSLGASLEQANLDDAVFVVITDLAFEFEGSARGISGKLILKLPKLSSPSFVLVPANWIPSDIVRKRPMLHISLCYGLTSPTVVHVIEKLKHCFTLDGKPVAAWMGSHSVFGYNDSAESRIVYTHMKHPLSNNSVVINPEKNRVNPVIEPLIGCCAIVCVVRDFYRLTVECDLDVLKFFHLILRCCISSL